MAQSGWRIVLDDGDGARAVCKFQALGDGGYCLIAPYHPAKAGWLMKFEVDYRLEDGEINLADMQHYESSDRVKLSHHWDGFVQFSGVTPQTIRSGLNPLTGEPKGLGIMTAPIWRPIRSGPTCGIALWGMSDFTKVANSRDTDILFNSDDIYYQGATASNCNGYHVEAWVFYAPNWEGVSGSGNNLRLSMHFPGHINVPQANLEFRVLPLTGPSDCFLGVRATRISHGFASPSGYRIGGPSDRRTGEHTATTLAAQYPKDDEIDDLLPESLDYNFRGGDGPVGRTRGGPAQVMDQLIHLRNTHRLT